MRISDWSSDVCSSDLVHIAFDHEHAAGLAGSGRGAIEIVERAALVEQRGFGRIQIFGLAVADDAAAERDRKSYGQGPSVSVRVDIGGRRSIKKKKHTYIISVYSIMEQK